MPMMMIIGDKKRRLSKMRIQPLLLQNYLQTSLTFQSHFHAQTLIIFFHTPSFQYLALQNLLSQTRPTYPKVNPSQIT